MKKKLLVLGDSHAYAFAHSKKFEITFTNYKWEVLTVQGATVSGLANPNSKTQALPKFMDKVESEAWDTVLLLIGEVDLGFVIWFRADKYQSKVDDMFAQTQLEFEKFIFLLKGKCKNLVIISVPLPTISDDSQQGVVANQRKSITASQRERTELTLKFNLNIKKFCEISSISFLDLDSDSLGDNGLVKNTLLNEKLTDHHYNKKEYIALLTKHLSNVLLNE